MIRLSLLYLTPFFSVLLIGCSHFSFNASMCDSMQPGQVSTDCRNYNDDEAAKASLPIYNEQGECLNCNKPKAVEIRQ